MPDKIQWKRSIQQDESIQGSLPDPKKLVIYCNYISSIAKLEDNTPVMFSIHNQNFQDISDFDMEPEYDYPFNKSNLKWEKYDVNKVFTLSVGLIGGNFIKLHRGKVKVGMSLESQSDGELYVRNSYANLSNTGVPLGGRSETYSFTKGTNKISFILDTKQFSPLNVVCFGTSANCHISKCFIYCEDDIKLDEYIKPKSQDIVLDHYFIKKGQYIKYDGVNWIDQDNNKLSEHDQQQLNSIQFTDNSNIVGIDVLIEPYLSFELSE